MRKLILRNHLALGDIVMLTAAVRDLHECYPGQYLTDVRTSCPQIWENNRYVTPISDNDPDAEVIDCHYPLIHQSNQRPNHFINGFISYLNERLGLNITATAFKGDIHLSFEEKGWMSQVEEVFKDARPFWIIVSGGKMDFTIKWWPSSRFQSVVNAFRDKIQFVQVGADDHYHPPLDGVYDLRGKTDIRQLIRLVYHSQGVVCGVTSLMHLAAAVETKDGTGLRPCVVIAGGREPSHWERYPGHRFLDTIGLLPCCSSGGCWRARAIPVGDGDSKDFPENLCVDVVDGRARCMDMISVNDVVREVSTYFNGRYYFLDAIPLAPQEHLASERNEQTVRWEALESEFELTEENSQEMIANVTSQLPLYPPGRFSGDGIVICGGGARLFPAAWVCINLLRDQGCRLPVQLWYLGAEELDDQMASLVEGLGVRCVDAREVERTSPMRMLGGWELKAFAITHCQFRRVLLLDADNMPLTDVTRFFDWPEFKATGAVFWPDFTSLAPDRKIWSLIGVNYVDEPEFESGQILIDKEIAWRALLLTLWLNANSDFYYKYIHGDKETFHFAFRKLDQPFAMPSRGINALDATMCQHDFQGNRVFQHRNLDKWRYEADNRNVADFWLDDRCRSHLRALQRTWSGTVKKPVVKAAYVREFLQRHDFTLRSSLGDSVAISFGKNGLIAAGRTEEFQRWQVFDSGDRISLALFGGRNTRVTFVARGNGLWVADGDGGNLALSAEFKPCGLNALSEQRWDHIFSKNILSFPSEMDTDTVVIDIGTAEAAFACACIARGCRYVYGFEPDEKLYSIGRRHMERAWVHFTTQLDEGPFSISPIGISTEPSSLRLSTLLCEYSRIDMLRICSDSATEMILEGREHIVTKVQIVYIHLTGHSYHGIEEKRTVLGQILAGFADGEIIACGEEAIIKFTRARALTH